MISTLSQPKLQYADFFLAERHQGIIQSVEVIAIGKVHGTPTILDEAGSETRKPESSFLSLELGILVPSLLLKCSLVVYNLPKLLVLLAKLFISA